MLPGIMSVSVVTGSGISDALARTELKGRQNKKEGR